MSPAASPAKEIRAWSPGRMSGVTLRSVPAPQQAPPGWLTSKATSPSWTTALAEPMTWPARVTSSRAVSPMRLWKPSTVMKSRSGKTTRLSGKAGTAAEATSAPVASGARPPARTTAAAARLLRPNRNKRFGLDIPRVIRLVLRM
jgi:hypothetical protein